MALKCSLNLKVLLRDTHGGKCKQYWKFSEKFTDSPIIYLHEIVKLPYKLE